MIAECIVHCTVHVLQNMGSRTLWQDILVASRQEADAEGVTDTIVAEVANTTRITCDTTTSACSY